MVQLSKQADYGVILMTYFASLASASLQMSAREIAHGTQLPLPTVTKILKLLTKAGLLCSTQGSHGGYRLAQAVKDISIADVIEAIDGIYAMTECSMTTPGICKTEPNCHIKHHWLLINQAVRSALKHLPLSMMTSSHTNLSTPLPQFSNLISMKKVS